MKQLLTLDDYKLAYPNLIPDDAYVEHPDGWDGIVLNLLRAINSISFFVNDKHKQALEYIQIQQTKEKFGGLRFYYKFIEAPLAYNGEDETKYLRDRIDGSIAYAEVLSRMTCVMCGQIGTQRTDRWIRCTCDICEAEYKKRLNKS